METLFTETVSRLSNRVIELENSKKLSGPPARSDGAPHSNYVSNCTEYTVRTVLHWTVLYCTTLHCVEPYCAVLHCTVLHCTVLNRTVLYCTVLHCTVQYCTVLYCTVLYCTVQCSTVLLLYHTVQTVLFSMVCCYGRRSK